MQTLVERGCGLDAHQATVVACLLIVLESGKVHKPVRTFGTTIRELVNFSYLQASSASIAMP
jgi:hypothetical protein